MDHLDQKLKSPAIHQQKWIPVGKHTCDFSDIVNDFTHDYFFAFESNSLITRSVRSMVFSENSTICSDFSSTIV